MDNKEIHLRLNDWKGRKQKISFSDARIFYEKLVSDKNTDAQDFALEMLSQFPSRQFFYTKLMSENYNNEIQRCTASIALRMSEKGFDIDYKILAKAKAILFENLNDTHVSKENTNNFNSSLLEKIHCAKIERKWNDAYKLLEKYVKDNPNDQKMKLDLGLIAYRSGLWSERASSILALSHFKENKKAKEAFSAVDSFFKFCSIPLKSEENNKDIEIIQSPTSVFKYLLPSHSSKQAGEGVIMITPSLAGGGAERIAATICNGFLKTGHSVEMAIYELPGKSGRDPLFYSQLSGLKYQNIHNLDLKPTLVEPFIWLPPNLSHKSQAIYEFILARRPHTLYLTLDMANLAGCFAALIAGVPNIIMHCHNQRPSSVYAGLGMEGWASAYRILLQKKGVYMVAVSQAVADDYASWMGIDKKKIEIILNGLDLEELTTPDHDFIERIKYDLSIPKGSLIVGTAFRFEDVKRPDIWIQMANIVHQRRKDVHFVLFGEGSLFDAAKAKCRDFGMENNVHFEGHVSDLYRRLPLLDIFVLSSRSEGLPNVLLEAQAAGAIPITFNVGGCGETMINGKTGILVDEQTDEALADAVLRVLEDKKWRYHAKLEGRKFVLSNFSVDRMLTSFERIFKNS